MSDQHDPLVFRDMGNFYTYDNELYTKQFPKDWVLDMERDATGPKHCRNCAKFGHWRGVFISYCCNCSTDYSGTRGPGFISVGLECSEENSIFGRGGYMEGFNLSEVGDISFNEEDVLDENGKVLVPYDLLLLEDGYYVYDDSLYEKAMENVSFNEQDVLDENGKVHMEDEEDISCQEENENTTGGK